jgi:SAM-dependent methyltransferase
MTTTTTLPSLPVTYVDFPDMTDRPRFLQELYGAFMQGRVLDVGCDKAALRAVIGKERYTGIDRSPQADVHHDLQRDGRLGFADAEFETVVCTDVLEHLDNLHEVFDELVRVAGQHLLVTLPNNWNAARQRLRRGHGHIGLYGLPLDPPEDPHRWFFSLLEAEAFLRGQADRHGLEILDLRALEKPRPVLVRAGRSLLHPVRRHYLNLYAHTLACAYRKRPAGSGTVPAGGSALAGALPASAPTKLAST